MRPAVPPFVKPKTLVLSSGSAQKKKKSPQQPILERAYINPISHVLISVQAKPKVEIKRKFR